jgi:hypothetical protein
MGSLAAPVLPLAQMHQGHDQKIGQKVASVTLGDHNQRFESAFEIVEAWIAREMPCGNQGVLIDHGGDSSRNLLAAGHHIDTMVRRGIDIG